METSRGDSKHPIDRPPADRVLQASVYDMNKNSLDYQSSLFAHKAHFTNILMNIVSNYHQGEKMYVKNVVMALFFL